ncbi:hypothetical protein JCM21900_004081 [Sporobolomyces salmonicolor]
MRPWLAFLLLPLTLTQAQDAQRIFSYPALPPSAYLPTHLSSSVELGGSLTRSSATYQLIKDQASSVKGDVWVVGVRQGGKSGGWVEATEGKGAAKKHLDVTVVGGNDDITFYSLPLTPPSSGAKTTVTISTVLSHQTSPSPETLPQNADSIYMTWAGDLLAPLAGLSPEQKAKVEEVKVKVKAPTPRVAVIKQPEGFSVNHSQGSATVTFTSKGAVADLPAQVASVHYQQPDAIASIRRLDRIVELSHWGANLAIQDNIDLANAGPELRGHFARIDYQKAAMHRRQGALALNSLSIPLPPGTHAPYYYDAVGNVSTSRFRPSSSALSSSHAQLPSQKKKTQKATQALLELTPRYPLLGGWNYSFTVGYDLPLGDFVKTRKDGAGRKYVAAVPFLTPIKNVAVDEVRLEIRLPEGARNIRVTPPFLVDSHSAGLARSYLDSTGRPTVVLEKKSCTDRHGGEVLIEYDLPLVTDLLQKPLACAGVLSSIFLATIVAKRLKWGIEK